MTEQATLKSFFSSAAGAPSVAPSGAPSGAPSATVANARATGAARKAAAPRARRVKLAATRLQPVSAAQLEKKVESLRAKLPLRARIVVYSFCWRLRCGSADDYRVVNESNGPAFDTQRGQTVLSYYEFMGIVNASETIADALMDAEDTHVLVVDGTAKAEFARLAACFAAIALKITRNGEVKTPAPSNPLFAAALAAAKACTTTPMLHYAMEAHFDAHMAYEVEPVEPVESDKGKKRPRKV
jgi:hypothetical protein